LDPEYKELLIPVNQNVSGIHIEGMGESFRRKAKAKVLEQKDLTGRKGY